MRLTQAFSLVEALVALSIIGIVLVFVMHTQTLFFDSGRLALETTKATYLAEEGQELIRYIRDEDWNQLSTLTTGTNYYFSISGGAIAVTTTPEVIEGRYTRSFVLSPLSRSVSGDLVSSGGTNDTGGRLVTVNVVWDSNLASLDSIVTNMHGI